MRTYTKKDERLFAKTYERIVADFNAMADELERTKAELQKAREAYERRTAERDVAREQRDILQQENTRLHISLGDTRIALAKEREKHQKLSEIVRLGMTPEQYQRAHATVEEYDRRLTHEQVR